MSIFTEDPKNAFMICNVQNKKLPLKHELKKPINSCNSKRVLRQMKQKMTTSPYKGKYINRSLYSIPATKYKIYT